MSIDFNILGKKRFFIFLNTCYANKLISLFCYPHIQYILAWNGFGLWEYHNNSSRPLITFLFRHPSILKQCVTNTHFFFIHRVSFSPPSSIQQYVFVWIYDHIYGNSLYLKIGVNSGWISFIHELQNDLSQRNFTAKRYLSRNVNISK